MVPDRTRSIGGPLERVIVNDDGNAIGRQLHVDLEAVGAERHAVVDRGQGVFRREACAAAMGEDQRTIGLEDRGPSNVHGQC